VLAAKPALRDAQSVVFEGSSHGGGVDPTIEDFLDFRKTFENMGLVSDWTLTLWKTQKGIRDRVSWSSIQDVYITVAFKAAKDFDLRKHINEAFEIIASTPQVRQEDYVFFFKTDIPEKAALILGENRSFTDDVNLPNGITFALSNFRGVDRKLKRIDLILIFDETIPKDQVPSLDARVTKFGDPNDHEIIFRSTAESDDEARESDIPPEILDRDPAGNWSFRLLSEDAANQDADGQPKSLEGLSDIVLRINYEYTTV